ncbi:MAG: hypothetical protein AAFZ65_21070, partial [Planctomycetota bacterium]
MAKAEKELESARAALAEKEFDYDRQRELFPEGLASEKELQIATRDRDQASAKVGSAQADVDKAIADVEVAD